MKRNYMKWNKPKRRTWNETGFNWLYAGCKIRGFDKKWWKNHFAFLNLIFNFKIGNSPGTILGSDPTSKISCLEEKSDFSSEIIFQKNGSKPLILHPALRVAIGRTGHNWLYGSQLASRVPIGPKCPVPSVRNAHGACSPVGFDFLLIEPHFVNHARHANHARPLERPRKAVRPFLKYDAFF